MIIKKVLNTAILFSLFLVCFAEASFAQTTEDLTYQVEQIMHCLKNNQIPMAKAHVARFYAPEYHEFLIETFGDELGSAYARDFQELAPSLADFVEVITKRFQMEVEADYEDIKCFKIDNPSDIPTWVWQREQTFLLQNMKKPVSLYEILFYVSKEREIIRPIANFVIIDGSFKLIGQPEKAAGAMIN
jgi:hypothetical protein